MKNKKLSTNKKKIVQIFIVLMFLISSISASAIKIEKEKDTETQNLTVQSIKLGQITVTPEDPWVVIGKISDGKIISGVKHSFILASAAYLILTSARAFF